MKWLTHSVGVIALCASLLVQVQSARAVTWELALAGIGNQTVKIRDCVTGVEASYQSDRPWTSPNCGGNLLVSFDGVNSTGVIELVPYRYYVFTLAGWGNKSFSVRGGIGSPINNDDMYLFTNSAAPPVRNPFGCFASLGLQIVEEWPAAVCPPPPPAPLSLVLKIDHTTVVGSKTSYFLMATATGGSGTLTYTWQNATMTTASGTNPSLATRTKLNTQSVTVTAIVQRGTESVSKSIALGWPEP